MSASVFADISPETYTVKYGGKIVSNFTNRTGARESSALMAGYGWLELNKHLDNNDILTMSSGWSYEQATVGQLLVNHAYLEYKTNKQSFRIGRSLNAAGQLHHDLSDFGAPSLGIDNIPNSSFFAGSFTGNTAQQIAQPFANRLSYYAAPFSFAALGVSYTPHISKDHPADYEFYTKADHTHEISAALSLEQSYKNRFIGATFGITRSRYASDRNFYQLGDATSRQFSFYLRHDLNADKYKLYEMVWGCMNADAISKDCRAGWQISNVYKKWIESIGYKKRIASGEHYDDYSTGYMYRLGANTDIGLESILRIKQNESFRDGDFHWNFGISHHF